MNKAWRRHAGLVCVGGLLASGCNSEDTEHLAKVGRVTAAKLEAATGGNEKLASSWQALKGDLNQLGLDARVANRIRWDKSLAEFKILVSAKNGEVELKGTVRDLSQRRRAVELAESTMGVDKVTDLLEIQAP